VKKEADMKKGLIKGKKGSFGFLIFILSVFLYRTSAFADTHDTSFYSRDFSLVRGGENIIFSHGYEARTPDRFAENDGARMLGLFFEVKASAGELISNLGLCPGDPSYPAQQQNAIPDKNLQPPLKAGKLIAEFLGGVAVEVGCGLLGVLLASAFLSSQQPGISDSDALLAIFESLAIVGGSWLIGPLIGVPLVVTGIGSMGNEKGEFWAAWFGSLLGLGLSAAIAGMGHEGNAATYSFLLAPPIFSVIGYNLTRKYKPGREPKTALLNFKDGDWTIGVPAFQIVPAGPGARFMSTSLSVANIEF
jgi:hypothetical protein